MGNNIYEESNIYIYFRAMASLVLVLHLLIVISIGLYLLPWTRINGGSNGIKTEGKSQSKKYSCTNSTAMTEFVYNCFGAINTCSCSWRNTNPQVLVVEDTHLIV